MPKIIRIYLPGSPHTGKLADVIDEYGGGYLVRVHNKWRTPLWVSYENAGQP